MKTAILKVTLCGLLGFSLIASAASVIVHETPAAITTENGVYVVPAGTTANYYYYNTNDSQYVCTKTAPADLASVESVPLSVKFGTETSEVRCYPSSNFVIQ